MPEPGLDLDTTRIGLGRIHGGTDGLVAAAALAHLDRQLARVIELEARIEALLAHEVRVGDELAESLLGAHDDLVGVARELRDDEVRLYLRGAPAQCERAADRARRIEAAARPLGRALFGVQR